MEKGQQSPIKGPKTDTITIKLELDTTEAEQKIEALKTKLEKVLELTAQIEDASKQAGGENCGS